MDISQTLDALAEVIAAAKPRALGGGAIIDREQAAQLVEHARSVLPEEIRQAKRINEEARLRSLKASFIILAAIALLAVVPARGLPNYTPGDILVEGEAAGKKAGKKKVLAAA